MGRLDEDGNVPEDSRGLHHGAGEGDQLAKPEESEIPMAECRDMASHGRAASRAAPRAGSTGVEVTASWGAKWARAAIRWFRTGESGTSKPPTRAMPNGPSCPRRRRSASTCAA